MEETLTISQIDIEIVSNAEDINKLHKQLIELNRRQSHLYKSRENILYELFSDYIQIGTKYDITKYLNFTGLQTGVKKGEISYSPSFSNGDSIEFTKKNKKSIVITCLTKVISKLDRTNGVRKSVTTKPNWTFRVDMDSLYHGLIRDPQFKLSFETYVRRTESLNLLLL